ncbi:MAG: hypothetical protein WC310_01520 [Patescibacteria group bacterium]
MKKIVVILLLLALLATVACAGKNETKNVKKEFYSISFVDYARFAFLVKQPDNSYKLEYYLVGGIFSNNSPTFFADVPLDEPVWFECIGKTASCNPLNVHVHNLTEIGGDVMALVEEKQ